MKTYVRKDYRGNWQATSFKDLGNQLRIKINTHKTDGGLLVSHASVCKVEGNFETHKLYQDYSARIFNNKVRCTEKQVTAQHNHALTYLDDIMIEVNAKYNL